MLIILWLLAIGFAILLSKVKVDMLIREAEKEVVFASVIENLVKLECKYYALENNDAFKKYPQLRKYLSQIPYVISGLVHDFSIKSDSVKLIPVKVSEAEQYKGLFQELDRAPDTLKTLVKEYSHCAEALYRLKQPFKYRLFKFRNRSLLMLIEVVLFTYEHFSKWTSTRRLKKEKSQLGYAQKMTENHIYLSTI